MESTKEAPVIDVVGIAGEYPGGTGQTGKQVPVKQRKHLLFKLLAEFAPIAFVLRMDEQRGGPHRGRGPKGYTRSDERIREDVNDRLSDDPFVDASEIEVMVWIDPAAPASIPLAPLTRDHVLPLASRKRVAGDA